MAFLQRESGRVSEREWWLVVVRGGGRGEGRDLKAKNGGAMNGGR